jgi:protoporphyrinogen oxidase
MPHHRVVIIGAGLTGLSCAYHLSSDYLLLERESEPGGIVCSKKRPGGFLCDVTGHWLHLRNPDSRNFIDRVMPGRLVEHPRRAVVFSNETFTPYPFQANTHGLPREVVLDCLLGLLKARHPEDFGLQRDPVPPTCFRQWVLRHFGEGISRHFMAPYNEKLLGVGLDELMPQYAERFIPMPSIEDVVKGALGFSREHLGYNATFSYPREGGIGALPRAIAAALPYPPVYGAEVVAIDLHERTVTLGDGSAVGYDWLLNTSPLKSFVSLLRDAPATVVEAASRLRATTVSYFDIGIRGKTTAHNGYHWVYFPEPEYVFYRIGSYSAVSRESAPPGCRSYYVEMSGLASEQLSDPEGLKPRVLSDMKKVGLLVPEDELLFMELCTIPHAYVIFDSNYVQCRNIIMDHLKAFAVLSKGRWGGWEYGGMEDALLDGKRAAEIIRDVE